VAVVTPDEMTNSYQTFLESAALILKEITYELTETVAVESFVLPLLKTADVAVQANGQVILK
jgi:hypothetical protein